MNDQIVLYMGYFVTICGISFFIAQYGVDRWNSGKAKFRNLFMFSCFIGGGAMIFFFIYLFNYLTPQYPYLY